VPWVVLAGCSVGGSLSEAPSESVPRTVSPTAAAERPTSALPTATAQDPGLVRPLVLPILPPGSPCPRSAAKSISADFGPAVGPGPIYPIIGPDSVVGVQRHGNAYIGKVLWVAAPEYNGPILIRGRQLGGSGIVLFGTGEEATETSLSLGASTSVGVWREWPTETGVPQIGCFAYQVDGDGFTIVIVFEAREA
jgi:hypothetical protein